MPKQSEVAMASLHGHAENYCHLVIEHEASGQRQFLFSTFLLV